eukprot:TRINITY_DN93091_c0_g1_i1.p2 TRINITY_DN93091_c0_g1~~TRINITY_DN93091_c0_g1_i1.p2  ORF type:complete len:198 (-),score=25.30 TRINITY_DN93091_c0_g1_i1:769-1362(-)
MSGAAIDDAKFLAHVLEQFLCSSLAPRVTMQDVLDADLGVSDATSLEEAVGCLLRSSSTGRRFEAEWSVGLTILADDHSPSRRCFRIIVADCRSSAVEKARQLFEKVLPNSEHVSLFAVRQAFIGSRDAASLSWRSQIEAGWRSCSKAAGFPSGFEGQGASDAAHLATKRRRVERAVNESIVQAAVVDLEDELPNDN